MSEIPGLSTAVPFIEDIDTVPDGIPSGFRVLKDGIHRAVEKDGRDDWVWLCSPIRVLALTRSRFGEDWGRLVEIADADGRIHRWAIPAEVFAGDGVELRRGALRLGLNLANGPKARQAFMDLLVQWRPEARTLMTDRLGWSDETCTAFTFGDGTTLGDFEIVHQAEHVPGIAREMRERGLLTSWSKNVSAPCAGNPILVASVSLAFAGPLLELISLEGGGIHLRGASSRGKSTAQRVATSVWGSPAFMQTWRATDNGLEGAAVVANSAILVLDEMGEVDGRSAGAIAYMLANGQSKTRAGRNGQARPNARWRLVFLSSGELSLADKMNESGKRTKPGQEVRLLDIRADAQAFGVFDCLHEASHPAAFADRLNLAAAENYGTAGRALVKRLIEDREGSATFVRHEIEAFCASAESCFNLANADGQVRRVIRRVGLISAAGEFATSLGLTNWTEGEAKSSALVVLRLWLDGRGGIGAAEAREAIERTRTFIVSHGASRFERIMSDGFSEVRAVHNRAGWLDENYFYLDTSTWRNEVHAGTDARRAAQHLAEAGLLVPESRSKLTRKTPRTVNGRPRTYMIPRSIIGEFSEAGTNQ